MESMQWFEDTGNLIFQHNQTNQTKDFDHRIHLINNCKDYFFRTLIYILILLIVPNSCYEDQLMSYTRSLSIEFLKS